MAVKPNISITNNFTAGLKTEFTGLNFPENAATSVDNCVFTLIGDVLRREGIDFEPNYVQTSINRSGQAISTYKWNNAGGDGNTQVIVVQVGSTLYFFQSNAATTASPLSAHKLTSTVSLFPFLPSGSSLDPSISECQFADGNGYLFVYHPNLNPFYCTFVAGVVTGKAIIVQTRDFDGIPEPGNPLDNFRPASLGPGHAYNLANQGWGKLPTTNWTQNIGLGTTVTLLTGSTSLPLAVGDSIRVIKSGDPASFQTGNVLAYDNTTGNVIMSIATFGGTGGLAVWGLDANPGLISGWAQSLGNYPSNGDVWWNFKDSTNTFNPKVTATQTTQNAGPAPKGYFILPTFSQDRTAISKIGAMTFVNTFLRPKTGAWFQGRVWYAGADATVSAANITPSGFYSWTEKIYFSQIATAAEQFGKCYQQNDPTSETLFDLLPTDGGVIQIQGCGSIYKLFPIQNGLLVFAANGIWFITGSQGIGFSANDYTITKISSVQNISSTSFVNAQGYPVFWNEEGIYAVSPSQQGGGLTVDNITLGTIFSFYAGIPLQSKKYARGDYNYVDYEIQWCYRSTNESSVTDRYQFDKILVYNTVNKAFYIYTLSGTPWIHDVRYVVGPGGSASPDPIFKYLTSVQTAPSVYQFTFSDEHDPSFKDWKSFDTIGTNFVSTFTSGYRLHGQGIGQWQPVYLYMYLRNDTANGYKIQSVWDYAGSRNSGRFSSIQKITNFSPNFTMLTRRHKLRGHGLAFQLKVSSVDGLPFDVMGWTVYEMVNTTP